MARHRARDGNEQAAGRAIRASGLPRDQLFVTTKLWVQDAGYERAKAAFQRSLDKLGLDRLDLYLSTSPTATYTGRGAPWRNRTSKAGCAPIGVSNFWPDRVMDLIVHNCIVPAVNQIETHPSASRSRRRRSSSPSTRCRSNPGHRSPKGTTTSLPASCSVISARAATSRSHMLRWLVQRGVVVIPKSVRRERMAQNLKVFDFKLDPGEMKAIERLDTGASLFLATRPPSSGSASSGWLMRACM